MGTRSPTGVLSWLPLFLYTVFLFAFTTNDILSNFPKRVQTVTRYTLLVFIPVIVLFNELSSFVDLSYRKRGGLLYLCGLK